VDYNTILYEVTPDRVATVTINRPKAFNSFTIEMRREFEHVWNRIKQDPAVHAVVLRAAEGKAFSTGADVKLNTRPSLRGRTMSGTRPTPAKAWGLRPTACGSRWSPPCTACAAPAPFTGSTRATL
jgi:enoyl-CoA hydratase/carnithine racemase